MAGCKACHQSNIPQCIGLRISTVMDIVYANVRRLFVFLTPVDSGLGNGPIQSSAMPKITLIDTPNERWIDGWEEIIQRAIVFCVTSQVVE